MAGLTTIDIIVIAVYLLGITYIGIRAGRKIKNNEDFFMGGRRFKKFYMIMYQFGSGTSADSAVSASSKIYTNGISGIWYLWMYLPVTPFYWLIAPILRRMRALTTGDFFEYRYNKGIALLYAFIGVVLQMVNIGVVLKGSGALLKASTGGAIPVDWAIIIMTVLFVGYGMAGGLAAAIVTDLVQGLLTLVFSVMLIPFALNAVGGMSGIHESISNPAMLSLIAPSDIGVFYILMGGLALLVGIGTLPHHMGICGAGRTELDGRIGFTYGSFLKRAATIAWAVVALAAIVMFADVQNVKPDETFGMVAYKFLPSIGYGLLGIFIATFLSAIMSTCDNSMISASALFTNNLYRSYFKPKASQAHYVKVGRISAFFVVAGGLAVAYTLPGVIRGVELMWIIPSLLGIAFWLGIFWRKMTSAAVWASTIAAFVVWFLSDQAFVVDWLAQMDFFEGKRFIVEKVYNDTVVKGIYFPWQILMYLSVGFVTGVVVSLFTKKESKEKLDHFYGLMRTPVDEPEELTEIAQLPEGKEFAKQNKLIKHPDLELQKPLPVAIKGFLLALIVVAALVGALLWIIS